MRKHEAWDITNTPVYTVGWALDVSFFLNDSAGHSSFHVGIIRDTALGCEGKHHTITA